MWVHFAKNIKDYLTKNSKIYLNANENPDQRILIKLGVKMRDVYSYTFEDIEFPSKVTITTLIF